MNIGMDSWKVKIDADISDLQGQIKKAQRELDSFTHNDHTVKLDLDTKTLDSAMKNLDNMLKSLSKGTGNFSSFENLSNQFTEMKNNIESAKKALGTLDSGSGTKSIVSTINSIDSTMQRFINDITKVSNTQIFDTTQFTAIEKTFGDIEKHLSSLKSTISDVGDGEEFSPLLSTIKEVSSSISNLSKDIKNIGLNMNFDLSVGNDEQFDKLLAEKKSNLITSYENLLNALYHRNPGGTISDEIYDFKDKFDNTKSYNEQISAYANFLKQLEHRRGLLLSYGEYFNDKEGKESLYEYIDKKYLNAVSGAKSALTRATNNNNNNNNNRESLKNIFGGTETDLSGVITKLETITKELNSIASAAKTMSETLTSGLNVSGSVEEISKLTEKVKELESQLQNIKSTGAYFSGMSGVVSTETILPSSTDFNEVLKNLDRTKSELKEIVEISKQVRYDSEGKPVESYTLKDKYGSTEIYGKSSHTTDGNIIRKNIKDSSLKEAQEQQKAIEKAAKAQAAALSKSRQATKSDTQNSVNNAVKEQLSAWKEIQKIRLQLSKTTDTGEISRLNELKKAEQERYLSATKVLKANQELYNVEKQTAALQKVSKQTTNQILTSQTKSQTQSVQEQQKAIESLISSAKRMQSSLSQKTNVFPSQEYKELVNKTTNAFNEMEAIQKKVNNNQNGVASESQLNRLKELNEEIKKYNQQSKSMTTSDKGSTSIKNAKEINKINNALQQNTRMSEEAKAQLRSYLAELKNNPSANVEKIASAWLEVVNAEKLAGRGGKSFMSAVGEKAFYGIASQVASYFSLYDVINILQRAGSAVIELNTDITDLAKVSEQSVKQIYNDFSSYADIAEEMGGTISDTITATTAWAKNGYSVEDSKELARVSLLYKNVGDDITIDEANESLVSTLQGYKLEADDAEHIIDVFNEVSNNEAISSSGIGEALQRSAASFNAANTSLEQSVALVTATRHTKLVEYVETYIKNIFNCHRSLYYHAPQYRGNYYMMV